MRPIRQLLIVPAATLHLISGGLALGGLALRSRWFGQQGFQHWSQAALRLLGVRLRVHGQVAPGAFLVPNHYSWVDILALQAITPATFLSKEEVREWPVIGPVAARLGTVFIGPRHGGADQAAEALRGRLADGESVVVFPEGRLNRSDGILPFISRLFRIPQEAGAVVQPVAVTYRPRNPQGGLGALVPEQSFLSSIAWLAGRGVEAEVHLLEPIPVEGRSRRELAGDAEQAVAQALSLTRVRPPRSAAGGGSD
ncbi:lysophospholipid acyltransferase family protein [Halorhodospira halophila]|uniref:lysophospholipid acyltransferase family protein n=1 Tax=Halorhodospira halophila TaxID=1053 RepID=UPI00191369E6|nr:lysophospholipid acyltransferase family protein [Halorhodospira halophila]MBK5943891.1 hypothetical protein [Halorhodospira halophila]